MKDLDAQLLYAVSGGGYIHIAGNSIFVDTTGIPKKCSKPVEKFFDDMIVFAINNPEPNMGEAMRMVGDHYDHMIAIGCSAYMNPMMDRIGAAIRAA